VEVRADAIRSNYARIGASAGRGVRVLPMVKANAYGLGVRNVIDCLEPLQPWGYGVAAVAEGLELREAGVSRPVVVCSPVPARQIEAAVEAELQLSISTIETLDALEAAARRIEKPSEWHLDVDTGMGRSGFDWRRPAEWMPEVLRDRPGLKMRGCYTHLHSADENSESIHEQWNRFSALVPQLTEARDGVLVHVLNSAGVLRAPELAAELVRPGIFLYGGQVGPSQPEPEPVVSLRARVVHVRDAEPGTTLGYGSTYAATRSERWATLSIGYGDGLPRSLSNRGKALVGGAVVPIIGRISMDVTVVDITGIPGVDDESVATFVGEQDDLSIGLDELAESAGTISYEVLTGWTGRLPRIWV